MASLTATLVRSVFGSRPEIVCADETWCAGISELRKRAGGYRESGAFLLGSNAPIRRIEEFVYYDDIDSNSLLTGIVRIDGRRLGDLWAHCRKTGRSVVADIHVHPGGFGQSASDKANPIIAEVGHIAIILPHYATRGHLPGEIGMYQYLGSRHWRDRSFDWWPMLHVGWWPSWH